MDAIERLTYLKAPLLPSSAARDCQAQYQNRCFMLCSYPFVVLFANPSTGNRHIRDSRPASFPEMEVRADQPVVPCFFLLAHSEDRSHICFPPDLEHTSRARAHSVDSVIPSCHARPGLLSRPARHSLTGLMATPSLPTTLPLKLSSWHAACGTSPPDLREFMVA